jgi:prepilin-type N-terminal cleavage/methylation domain-containing protein
MEPDRWDRKTIYRVRLMTRRFMKRLKGFTLIEMILVATLIVILSTLAIASMRAARNKGYETGAATGLKSLAAAQEMFLVDNGYYAGGFSALATTYLPRPYPRDSGSSIYIKQYSVVWMNPNIAWVNQPVYTGGYLINRYSLNTFTIFALPKDPDLKTFLITDSGAVQYRRGSEIIPY